MVFFNLKITLGLYNLDLSYAEKAVHMDTYDFCGTTFKEVRDKVHKVFGEGTEWAEGSSIDLAYCETAGESRVLWGLRAWDSAGTENHKKLMGLLYG